MPATGGTPTSCEGQRNSELIIRVEICTEDLDGRREELKME